MRAHRTFRPTLDAALEGRVALSTIVPTALLGMTPNLTQYQVAQLVGNPASPAALAAQHPATVQLVLAGALAPHVSVGFSAGTGAGTSIASNLGLGLNTGLNSAFGSLGTSGLGTGLLNNAFTSLGTSLNTAFTGLGSTLNTGTFTSPSPVQQFIAGLPVGGNTTAGGFSAGTTIPMSGFGSTLGMTASNGVGLGTTGAFGSNLFGSSVFATNPFGMGFVL
jgi:hypothetical protein